MRTPVTLLFVDALAARYLDDEKSLPYLAATMRTHGRAVRPLPAFEGIGATIFTGKWPDEHGVWTNFERQEPRVKLHDLLFRAYDIVLRRDRLRWAARYVTYRALRVKVPIPNQIPAAAGHHFRDALAVDPARDADVSGFPTIAGAIAAAGKRFHGISSYDDEEVTTAMCEAIGAGRGDVVYGKIGRLDVLGHKLGPRTERFRAELSSADAQVARIAAAARAAGHDLVIFSDHGMAPIERRVDVLAALRAGGVRPGKDVLCFLDSTMVRTWCDDATRARVERALNGLVGGFLVTESMMREERLPVDPARLGQTIFALEEGWALPWDYFHRSSALVGAHGYFRPAGDDVPVLMHVPADGGGARIPARPDFTMIHPLVLELAGSR